ncbi:hypothetical protein [Corynebacterium halotolerans]|nr:hypothetical protein [Corynebacterium halotolerans]
MDPLTHIFTAYAEFTLAAFQFLLTLGIPEHTLEMLIAQYL